MTGMTNAIEEIVHGWTMDGSQDDDAGDCQEAGAWYALFRGPASLEDIKASRPVTGFEYALDLSDYRALRSMAGCIYTCDDQGFCDVAIYTGDTDMENAWNRVLESVELASGPADDDIVIQDFGNLGSQTGAFQYGKMLFEIGPDDDRDAMLREYMDKQNYWPNVWYVSDHGNATLLEIPE
jgi:hypothetical protein